MRPSSHKIDTNTLRYRHAVKTLSKFLRNHIFLIIAAISVWCYFVGLMTPWDGTYQDADGYMRAIRLHHWLLNPTFFEQPIPESNYPFGEIMHWTRPMDILWALFTIPFLHLTTLKDSIFIGGAFISPILGILSVITLAYGLRRQFNIYLVLIGCSLFISNPLIAPYFHPARPDHHSLMILLSTYAFSLTLCWLKKRQNRYLRLMGITLALATFTAIEGIIIYACILGFFLYLYCFKNIALQSSVKMSKYFALSLSIFWLLNPPYQGWLFPDNGRISILFVSASWCIFFSLWILNASHIHTAKLKILCLVTTSLGSILALTAIFGPDIFKFPLTEQTQFWSKQISEMASVITLPWQASLSLFSINLIALILNLYMLRYMAYQRLMILNLCFAIPLYTLTLSAIRFNNYVHLYSILPFIALLDMLYKKSPFAHNKSTDFPSYLWAIYLCIVLFEVSSAYPLLYLLSKKNQIGPFYSFSICQNVKNTGGTLVTDIFMSPLYIWNCDINTIGTPYHRNIQGIIDNHKILHTENDGEIIPLILKHQVSQILLFDDYGEKFDAQKHSAHSKELYYRLITRQNIPAYLEEIHYQQKNVRHYRIKI